jgi:hypothetical protein
MACRLRAARDSRHACRSWIGGQRRLRRTIESAPPCHCAKLGKELWEEVSSCNWIKSMGLLGQRGDRRFGGWGIDALIALPK